MSDDRWKKATKDRPCPKCGKGNRCKIAPDGTGGICWRSGSKEVWQDPTLSTGPKRYRDYWDFQEQNKPQQKPSYMTPSYLSVEEAIEAAGKFCGGEFADYWEYPGGKIFTARFNLPDGSKQFRPVHRNGQGWKIGDPPDELLPLYKVDEIPATGPIFLVEGEKCCDIARAIGLPCVTSSHGSSAPEKSDWSPLAKRYVIILPDNDDPGRKYAAAVMAILRKLGCWVKIVELPDLEPGDDIEEFRENVGDRDEVVRQQIEQLAENVPWVNPPRPLGDPIIVMASDVQPSEVEWLWKGRVAIGRITIICGRPGCGKSFMTADMSARVTTGAAWPDGQPCDPGNVLMISAEDDPSDTIRPRLDAHGADCSRVGLMTMISWSDGTKESERMFSLADLPSLETALKTIKGVKLVIIDPIGSFLGKGADSFKDNEVRAVLSPLAQIARKMNIAVVMVAHNRKGSSEFADDTVMGSRAFTGIARIVWHVSKSKDDKDQRLFLPGKNNLAKEDGGLSFRIDGSPARLVWDENKMDMTADDVARTDNSPEESKSEFNEAEVWLRNRLESGLPVSVNEIKQEVKDAALSAPWRVIQKVATKIGIVRERGSFAGNYNWRLPARIITPASSPEPDEDDE